MTIQWIFQASAVMSAAVITGWAVRRWTSAAQRHAIYLAAVIALLLLPAVSRIGSAIPVSISAVEVPTLVVNAGASPSPLDWSRVIQGVWMGGVGLLLLRYLAGAGRAIWLQQTSREFRDGARLHSSIRVPMAVGWLRPQVLLPGSASNWPEPRIQTAIAHERAHIARFDGVWTLLAAIASAIFWFHPLAWVLADRLRQESERACDDAVLRSGADAGDYAAHLIEAAREAGDHWEFAAGIAMADAPKLEARVVAVLNDAISRAPLSRTIATATAVAAGALVLLVTGSVTSRAQDVPAGQIEITVVDPSGARVPDAPVSVADSTGRIHDRRSTSGDGSIRFDSLPAGEYLIEVQAKGFKPASKGIHLSAYSGARVAFALDIGRIFETVKVSGNQAAPTPTVPMRIRVGGNVQAAKVVNQPKPAYPQSAKDQGIQGTVFLQAIIHKDGTVGALEVLGSPDASLSTAAMDAVRQWTYQPTRLNGEPVEVITRINLNFTLSD